MKTIIAKYLNKELFSGVLLISMILLAISLKNSTFEPSYNNFLNTQISIEFSNLFLIKRTVIQWVNNGLMSIFFLLIGLEIKRELLTGHLSSASKVALPAIAALGGMIFPAILFIFFNFGDQIALKGWAIPTPTDIAFVLILLTILGNKIPTSLKIFLMTLAVFDDIGAILIIALFYSSELSLSSLVFAFFSIVILFLLNYFEVKKLGFYFLVGIFLWFFILNSGIHATLAGIILAFAVPLKSKTNQNKETSPSKILEHHSRFWVNYYILPLFIFLNTGIDLSELTLKNLTTNLSLGIIFGLFIGKQLGVFLFTYFCVKLKISKLPALSNWMHIYGAAILTGVGFTMCIFVDTLAFEGYNYISDLNKIAIFIGSILSAMIGFIILKNSNIKNNS
ncbi:Na+/H+ antiporter NhaA [Campylobacterota bacterium DY0563]